MSEAREAFSVQTMPVGPNGEDAIYYCVGRPYYRFVEGAHKNVGTVSRITVTRDLPGLHCDMERVRVFDGETMIYEAPLHSLEGVTYPHPNRTENPFT